MHHPTARITHTTAFVTPVVEHWLEREIAPLVHHEGSIRRPIASCASALTTELHLAPHIKEYPIMLELVCVCACVRARFQVLCKWLGFVITHAVCC